MKRLFLIGAMALAGPANADLISSTSADASGNPSPLSLNCLFNGVSADGSCATVTGDGFIQSGAAFNANAEYISAANWTIASSNQAAVSFILAIAGNASGNTFGIYDPGNISTQLVIYDGVTSAIQERVIQVDLVNTRFRVNDTTNDVFGTYQDFTGLNFGFFLESPEGNTFYSDPLLNGGDIQMVAFEGGSRTVDWFGFGLNRPWTGNEFVIAWEDRPYGSSDQDFNDLLVVIESVVPVPAPGTLALLGLGLVGIGFARRARMS